jgi:DNA-directed RNA polymerase specialized sigma24 family protein
VLIVPSQIDSLLLPFLESTDEKEEASLLVRLITEQADPVIRRILRYKMQFYVNQDKTGFQNPDVEEIQSDIHLYLLKRLRHLKEDPYDQPLSNLRGYVATIARNSCDEYLRRKYPKRRQLKDRVRYCLTNHHEFAMWEDRDHGMIGSLSEWRYHTATSATHLIPQSDQDIERFYAGLPGIDANRLELRNLIRMIFETCGGPMELDHLTGLIAKLRGIEDRPVESCEYENLPSGELFNSPTDAETTIEYHQILQQLWVEICQLSRPQRVALLLNLRSPRGINMITLFPATRVATFEQIADALEIPARQFEELWADLPMNDLSIAEFLGITRQQVINLRRSARDKLARHMKAFQESGYK